MTTTTKLLVVLLTVISTSGFAAVNDSSYVRNLKVLPLKGSDSYKLIYQAQEAEPVYVSIKNSRGDLLLNERYSKTDGFVLPLNMETAASGSYEVEVKGKLGTIKETIVHTSQADLLKERLFIQTKDGMFGVVGFDLGATDFNVLVYNDQSEMIYQDKVTSDGILNKVYNLEEVNSKWVNIVIYHEGDAIISSQLDLK